MSSGRKKIIKYFRDQFKKNILLTRKNIERKFSISLKTYFPKGMREVYQQANIPLVRRLRDRKELKEKIIKYIRTKVRKGFYPTHYEINEKFRTNIKESIRELYKLAGVEYKRDPNPFLRYKKEKKLVDIAQKLLSKLGYKIKSISIGPSKPKGADIIVEDHQKRLIPVEIKAFQKFGKIGQDSNSPYIRNEILQLKIYIKDLHASYGYLITSTDKKAFQKSPSNIKIIFGKDLKELLSRFKMYKELKDLEWISNSSISYRKEEMYKKIRKKILDYTAKKLENGKYVSRREIFKKFKVNPDSYFNGGMKEIYKALNIDVEMLPNYRMGRKFNKENLKNSIITFVKEEIKKGHFPTYKEIQKKFRCSVKLYFPGGIREIAKIAGIKYERKFATKTSEEKEFIKRKIIKYIKGQLEKGYYPGYRDFRKELQVDPLNYFAIIKEIYKAAGCNNPPKRHGKISV